MVTNSHTPDVRDISVSKTWQDDDNIDNLRPDSITVYLLADGERTDQKLSLSAESDWTGSFESLPVNKQGEEIQYSVEEEPVEGYVAEDSAGDMENGFSMVNTLIRGSISLKKVDGNGQPLSGATFEVRDGNGKAIKQAVSDDNGAVSFTGLAYGKYTVVETQSPEGFEKAEWSADADIAEQGQEISLGEVVNRRIPVPVPTSPILQKLSETGADVLAIAGVALAVLIAGIVLVVRRKRAGEAMLGRHTRR